MMYSPNAYADLLFSRRDLSDVTNDQKSSMFSELEQIDANRLLNTAPADLAKYLVEKYCFEAPTLNLDGMTATEAETKVDVRNDIRYFNVDRSKPTLVHGQRITVEIPIDGYVDLMYAKPSSFTISPPRARITGTSLFITFDLPHSSQDTNIRKNLDREIEDIQQYLGWVRNDINQFNLSLPAIAEHAVAERRERVLANQKRVAALGIPLKKKDNVPPTYAIPEIRRKVLPTLPPATSVPYEPEPVLDMGLYDHILTVLNSMAHVMERSPSTFESIGEEALRQLFLVHLNGQFDGAATGETFNVNGKTDILLRHNDRNVFIAECKFWDGPKLYRKTIDQLLGYKAWRDTKTAILIFNRGTAMTTVLDGIEKESTAHANYKRTENWTHESGFRYTFHHTGDSNREFILTVLVFDVPSPTELKQ